MTFLRGPLCGYVVASAMPLGAMLIGSGVGMPAFVFERLVILLVVGVAVVWGMGPAVVTALVAALGDNIILRDPAGRPTITGVRDVLDLVMFVAVALTVGWLVASARRDRARAEQAVESERHARSERDRLVAMVSHDLATPLAVVRSTVQFVRLAGTRAAIDMDRLWDRLDTASARATSLVRALADVQTLDAGDFSLDVQALDIRELVTPVVQMMDRMSERHPVVLALPEHPVIVECDAERLKSVFENLLSNAIKYSPDGGSIEVLMTPQNGEVFITVQDQGMGISLDALPRLFERGYRAPEAVPTAPGLGLGLSIAAEIVKRHGGTVEARGRQSRGTIITVRLPLAHRASTNASRSLQATAGDVG